MSFPSGHSSLSGARAVWLYLILYKEHNDIITCRNKAAICRQNFYSSQKYKRTIVFDTNYGFLKHAFNISHSITTEATSWNQFHQPKSYSAHILHRGRRILFQNWFLYSYFKVPRLFDIYELLQFYTATNEMYVY